MAQYRNFDIEMTIVPDAAGQYEAAFVIHEAHGGKQAGEGNEKRRDGSPDENPDKGREGQRSAQQDSTRGNKPQGGDARGGRYAFPPVGSYLTPDDAREQTEAWARKWIDANFSGQE